MASEIESVPRSSPTLRPSEIVAALQGQEFGPTTQVTIVEGLLDGTDLRDWDLRVLRRRIGEVHAVCDVSFDIGGIHDPMGNAFHTALTAEIPGSTVLITGCGPIGPEFSSGTLQLILVKPINRATYLLSRVAGGTVEEVILATNPTVEGEATALYLARLLKPLR